MKFVFWARAWSENWPRAPSGIFGSPRPPCPRLEAASAGEFGAARGLAACCAARMVPYHTSLPPPPHDARNHAHPPRPLPRSRQPLDPSLDRATCKYAPDAPRAKDAPRRLDGHMLTRRGYVPVKVRRITRKTLEREWYRRGKRLANLCSCAS